ncbi:hypothetical protein PHLGIDRAFT_191917 [Phlebiopsis gigantea 11061_1 CR5-6]|uniref:Uncharacterized protein n=1 Tax=Phlebiopsis gigantea (strain 11061_1 CR5-6) TaxID=745531 RepID=A0A0C3S3L6_PHLG1|nr:hypothetical protein PHLGIDRAFT_191917 [Phlebiopsis gigantea 11061_1 CR5-6]
MVAQQFCPALTLPSKHLVIILGHSAQGHPYPRHTLDITHTRLPQRPFPTACLQSLLRVTSTAAGPLWRGRGLAITERTRTFGESGIKLGEEAMRHLTKVHDFLSVDRCKFRRKARCSRCVSLRAAYTRANSLLFRSRVKHDIIPLITGIINSFLTTRQLLTAEAQASNSHREIKSSAIDLQALDTLCAQQSISKR